MIVYLYEKKVILPHSLTRSVAIIFSVVLSFQLKGQKVFNAYPFIFDHLVALGNMYNPAYEYQDKTSFIQIGYNDFNPLSNTIASYYANGRLGLGKDSALKSHRLGMFIINDKEGVYLIRLKAMMQYAYRMEMAPGLYWSNGLSLGFVNNALKANDVLPGESILAPDLDFGSFVQYKTVHLGLSGNQLFNNTIRFLDGKFQRKRYYSVTTGIEKNIRPNISLKVELYGRTGSEKYNKYVGSVLFGIGQYIQTGVAVKSSNCVSPMIGFRDVPVLNDRFGFLFSYAIPASKTILSGSGNYELRLEYKFD